MATIKCIIIDDEPVAIRILELHLSAFPNIQLVANFNNALSAIHFLHDNSVDLIFSDIDMPQMNGLQFLKTLKNPPSFIFTTAYRDYAVEAFDLDVVDYLLKPISLDRIARAINRFHERKLECTKPVITTDEESVINLKVDKRIMRLNTSYISYIESYGDYIICYYNDKKFVSRERLSNIYQLLPQNKFIRIHRQYVVAIDKITSLVGNMVSVNGVDLPVGRNYQIQLRQIIGV